jgi:DNA-binding CsgD family transcriptional regulator
VSKKTVNIIVVEPSSIICQGIENIFMNAGLPYKINTVENIREVEQAHLRTGSDIVMINPALIQNQVKEFHSVKKKLDYTRWIGIVYTYFDQNILSMLDDIIYINDTPNKIITAVQKLLSPEHQEKLNQESLSDREIDVLKLLVAGNANKEIAGKLNISTHTVITHRKNISQKTGIKSVSGLTIYAVVKDIISVDDYRE